MWDYVLKRTALFNIQTKIGGQPILKPTMFPSNLFSSSFYQLRAQVSILAVKFKFFRKPRNNNTPCLGYWEFTLGAINWV